ARCVLYPTESSEDKKKSVYIGSVQSLNLPVGTDTRVRNGITLSLINNFKNKVAVLDDEVVKKLLERLKLQQLTGCSTEKCEKQLNDALNADQKIEGTIINEGGKYSLTIKLFNLQDGTPSITNQVKREFTSSQLDYYINELTRSAIDSNYSINDKNAPQDNDPGKINLSNVVLKDVVGSDLSVLNFKSDDTTVDDLIKFSKETLQEGDESFKKKNYDLALKDYESILKGIARLAPEKQNAAKKYKDEIVKRIDNCYINIYNKSLGEIDVKIKSETSATPAKIKDFAEAYEKILLDYQGRIKLLNVPTNPNIESAIVDRLEKLDIANATYSEKKADLQYENYRFSQAIREYKKIYTIIASRPQTKSYKEYLAKLQKKIEATKETGASFVDNRVKAYCSMAEKKNFQRQLAVDKGKTFEVNDAEDSIKDSLLDARKTLQKSEFASEQLFDFYNKTVERINSDKRESLGKRIEKTDVDLEESQEITKEIAIRRSLLFPGYGQYSERPDKLKGKIMVGAGFVLVGSIFLTGVNYYVQQKAYNNLEGTSPAYFAGFSQYSSIFAYNDYQKSHSARSNVIGAYSFFTTSLFLYAALYVYNVLDIIFFTDRKEVLGLNTFQKTLMASINQSGFNFNISRVNTALGNSNSNLEQKYNFSYTYQW
ncbi:MAG TPA: hypothetical protein PKL30_25180, partial [Leptospiraceae bacterium]|nr:hypothetical protein [Leptospiraceae bacterium]